MKLLVLLVVVLLVLWLVRGSRRKVVSQDPPPPPLPKQEDIVSCSQCGLHVPRSDALPGRGGQFCSEAHRAEFERAQG